MLSIPIRDIRGFTAINTLVENTTINVNATPAWTSDSEHPAHKNNKLSRTCLD